jgi:hypothetical protein
MTNSRLDEISEHIGDVLGMLNAVEDPGAGRHLQVPLSERHGKGYSMERP